MPKKILLISYSFPPHSAPEAYLSAKTMGALGAGHQVDVLYAEPHRGHFQLDTSLEEYVWKRFRSVESVTLPGWLASMGARRLISRLFRAIHVRPDWLSRIKTYTLRVAERFRAQDYDTVVTWSQFHSAHLAGLDLKKKFPQMRWIARLSDPWVENPFNRLVWWSKRDNLRLEREVFEAADQLVFTTQDTVDLVMGKYEESIRKKARVVAHPFDPILYSNLPEEPVRTDDGRLVVRYLGNFYGKRNPKRFLKALQVILREDPELLSEIRFEFVGALKWGSLFPGKTKLPSELVSFLPPVSYLDSLKLMRTSAALLVIDAPAKRSVFLPSKLVDYLGAMRPIFGVTPPGASADLIGQLGGRVVDPSELSSLTRELAEFLRDLKSGESQKRMNWSVRDRYTVERIGPSLAELL